MKIVSDKQVNAVVLDASAIINLRNIPELIPNDLNVIPKVIVDEIKDFSSKMRLEAMLASNLLRVYTTEEKYKKMVSQKLKEIGSLGRLSEEDIEVLTLAYQIKQENEGVDEVIIITDDYEIQNSGSFLNISFKPVTQSGIRHKVRWLTLCKTCGIKLKKRMTCPNCGNQEYIYRVKGK